MIDQKGSVFIWLWLALLLPDVSEFPYANKTVSISKMTVIVVKWYPVTTKIGEKPQLKEILLLLILQERNLSYVALHSNQTGKHKSEREMLQYRNYSLGSG